MDFDFDRVVERRGTNSVKWDAASSMFGSSDVLPMWVADMDFPTPEAVRQALVERAQHGVFGYNTKPTGYYEAMLGWLKRRHDWEVQQEWLTTSPSVLTSIALLLSILTEPEDEVIVQTPVYHMFFNVVRANGRQVVESPLLEHEGRYTMDYEDLEAKLKNGAKLLLLCNPHNPVGRVWTPEELRKVGELCLKYRVPVISDEIHLDLVMEGHTHTVFSSLSEEIAANSIMLYSITKTFNLAGIHTSIAVIPNQEIRQHFAKRIQALSIGNESTFASLATVAAYTGGEAWLDGLRGYLRENYELLKAYLGEHLPQVKVTPLEATYLVWLDCRALGMSGAELHRVLQREGKVALNEGSTFGSNGAGFMRINIACPRATLEDGLKRIVSAFENTSTRTK